RPAARTKTPCDRVVPARATVVVDPDVEVDGRRLALDVVEQSAERVRPVVRRDRDADSAAAARDARRRRREPRAERGALLAGVAPRAGPDGARHRGERQVEPAAARRVAEVAVVAEPEEERVAEHGLARPRLAAERPHPGRVARLRTGLVEEHALRE